MINEADASRKFRNLISTKTLAEYVESKYHFSHKHMEEALYILFERNGIRKKTERGGKKYFNRANAKNCIMMNIFKLRKITEELDAKYENKNVRDDEDSYEYQVGYGRNDMSVASRELLANDDVFTTPENELYRTN